MDYIDHNVLKMTFLYDPADMELFCENEVREGGKIQFTLSISTVQSKECRIPLTLVFVTPISLSISLEAHQNDTR